MLKLSTMNKNHITGVIGEYFTCFWFFITQLAIPIKVRHKSKFGEIDLILRTTNTIIFCEVKTRIGVNYTMNEIENLVQRNQINRIKRSAEIFLLSNQKYQNFNIAFKISIVKSFIKKPLIFDF
jgi:putative endonuclease